MIDVKKALLLLIAVFSLTARGQTHFGVSLNIGNKLEFAPGSHGLRRPVTPSGSFILNHRFTSENNWTAQIGTTLGVLGYTLTSVMIDTLGPPGDRNRYGEYTLLYTSADILLGRQFPIGSRMLMIGAGGGGTFYICPSYQITYSVGVMGENNTYMSVFDAGMNFQDANTSLFGKAAAYFDLHRRFTIGAEYIGHTRPVAQGWYQFRHTDPPSQQGTIKLRQRELRLAVLYRFKPA